MGFRKRRIREFNSLHKAELIVEEIQIENERTTQQRHRHL